METYDMNIIYGDFWVFFFGDSMEMSMDTVVLWWFFFVILWW